MSDEVLNEGNPVVEEAAVIEEAQETDAEIAEEPSLEELLEAAKTEAAKNVLMDNAAMLDKAAAEYKSPKLKRRARANRGDADNLAPAKWNEQRKKMRDEQFEAEMQQAW